MADPEQITSPVIDIRDALQSDLTIGVLYVLCTVINSMRSKIVVAGLLNAGADTKTTQDDNSWFISNCTSNPVKQYLY